MSQLKWHYGSIRFDTKLNYTHGSTVINNFLFTSLKLDYRIIIFAYQEHAQFAGKAKYLNISELFTRLKKKETKKKKKERKRNRPFFNFCM